MWRVPGRRKRRAWQTSHVTLYPMPVGEPGGRAVEADAIPLAVEAARELKRPVQLSLSPSASQNHDRVAPGALARMTRAPRRRRNRPPRGGCGVRDAAAMRRSTSPRWTVRSRHIRLPT